MVIKSKRFSIKEDLPSIIRGAALAAAGAVVTFLLDTLPGIDFGASSPMVMAVITVFLNTIRKWVTESSYVK